MISLSHRQHYLQILPGSLRRILPAPFGWHTLYMLRHYTLYSLLTTCGILAIALSIDLTIYLPQVLAADQNAQKLAAVLHVGWYMLLRCADFLAELLPLSCFLGVLWCETNHTNSRERLIVWLSGRKPLQCLAPIVLFALLVGIVLLALNLYLRPAAVATQAAARLGSYGERFNRGILLTPRWIVAGNDLIQARLDPSSPPVLYDVRLYRMDEQHQLRETIAAEKAYPTGDSNVWIFSNGQRWQSTRDPGGSGGGATDSTEIAPAVESGFSQESLKLTLSPAWVSTYGINAKYFERNTFNQLRHETFSNSGEYWTWNYTRYALSFFVGGMLILAATLSQLLLAHGLRVWPIVCIALSGYLAHTLMKGFVVLGEHDFIGPALASWTVPVILFLICAAILRLSSLPTRSSVRSFLGV